MITFHPPKSTPKVVIPHPDPFASDSFFVDDDPVPSPFQQWMAKVDKELVRFTGLMSSDLPDVYDFHEAFIRKDSPAKAARAAYHRARTY